MMTEQDTNTDQDITGQANDEALASAAADLKIAELEAQLKDANEPRPAHAGRARKLSQAGPARAGRRAALCRRAARARSACPWSTTSSERSMRPSRHPDRPGPAGRREAGRRPARRRPQAARLRADRNGRHAVRPQSAPGHRPGAEHRTSRRHRDPRRPGRLQAARPRHSAGTGFCIDRTEVAVQVKFKVKVDWQP